MTKWQDRSENYVGTLVLNEQGRMIMDAVKKAFPGRFRFRGRGKRVFPLDYGMLRYTRNKE
jgi:hypothetical protein